MSHDPTLSPSMPDDGLIAGRYRIESELARGGIGVVYRARDERMGDRAIVIKVLLDKSTDSAWLQKKFEDERKALVRLNHPNIVAALDCGVLPNGQSYLVMEFVPGRPLRAWMREGPLPLEQIAEIVGQIGRALTAAHERGIHHRDLKPENIMLQELGEGQLMVKIIDFGIATVKEKEDASTHFTEVAGTPMFMAPEQLAGKPTAASDTYALAAITYEMLGGAPPFQPESIYELIPLQREGVKRRPSELRAGRPPVPPAAEDAVLKSLSFSTSDRHASAREFAGDFVRGLTGHRLPATAGPMEPSAETFVNREETRKTATPTAGPTAFQSSPAPAPRPKGPLLLIVGGLLAAVAIAGVLAIVGLAFLRRGTPLSFRYAIEVQQVRDGQPGKPFRLPGEMIFGSEHRIRVVLSSEKPGYLYIVNEGPVEGSGAHTFNVQFPESAEADSARVAAGQEISIPKGNPIVFDKAEGVEQLFIVWSKQPVAEMEEIKHVANATDAGEVKDEAERRGVHAFLVQHPPVKGVKMDAEHYTLVSGSGPVLVTSLKLEHH